jgi:hypothetical protein
MKGDRRAEEDAVLMIAIVKARRPVLYLAS